MQRFSVDPPLEGWTSKIRAPAKNLITRVLIFNISYNLSLFLHSQLWWMWLTVKQDGTSHSWRQTWHLAWGGFCVDLWLSVHASDDLICGFLSSFLVPCILCLDWSPWMLRFITQPMPLFAKNNNKALRCISISQDKANNPPTTPHPPAHRLLWFFYSPHFYSGL